MTEINQKMSLPNPDVSSMHIHIPEDSDCGTGTFTVVTNPLSVKAGTVISAAIVNPPRFQISANINAGSSTVAIVIGVVSDRTPPTQSVFRLPRYVKWNAQHTLVIQFAAWKIFSAIFDDKPLQELAERPH